MLVNAWHLIYIRRLPHYLRMRVWFTAALKPGVFRLCLCITLRVPLCFRFYDGAADNLQRLRPLLAERRRGQARKGLGHESLRHLYGMFVSSSCVLLLQCVR